VTERGNIVDAGMSETWIRRQELNLALARSDEPTGYCPDHGEYDPAGDCPGCVAEELIAQS
jgi:hypothetical protein